MAPGRITSSLVLYRINYSPGFTDARQNHFCQRPAEKAMGLWGNTVPSTAILTSAMNSHYRSCSELDVC